MVRHFEDLKTEGLYQALSDAMDMYFDGAGPNEVAKSIADRYDLTIMGGVRISNLAHDLFSREGDMVDKYIQKYGGRR